MTEAEERKFVFCQKFEKNLQLKSTVEMAAYRPFIKFLGREKIAEIEPFQSIYDIHAHPFSYGHKATYQQACNAAYYDGDLRTVRCYARHISLINNILSILLNNLLLILLFGNSVRSSRRANDYRKICQRPRRRNSTI